MKKLILITSALLTVSLSAPAQTIADWTFESFPASTGETAGPYSPEVGAGSASGFHSGTGGTTTYSAPSGNGSLRSYSANGWGVGDYYLYQVSTAGDSGTIYLSFDQTGSATGPKNFQLQYSTDGTTFNPIGSAYTVALSTWNTTTVMPAFTYTPDLSGISAAIDNQATLYFRMMDTNTTAINGTTVAAGGTDRMDNVYIGLTPLPEPSTYAMIASGAAGLFFMRRRK